jgi:ATP/maltotriose-dependent transcriptional regulator MalT
MGGKLLRKNEAPLHESRAYPIIDNSGKAAQVIRIASNIKRPKKNYNYQKQNHDNLKQALQNLSLIKLDTVEYLPDYNKPLSIREFEILHLASHGLSNPQIADILSISSHTVKSHFDHIFNKLGVNNRTMAVIWAARQGLI